MVEASKSHREQVASIKNYFKKIDRDRLLMDAAADLLEAMPTTNHPAGKLLRVVAHYERGTQTISGDVITRAVSKATGERHE